MRNTSNYTGPNGPHLAFFNLPAGRKESIHPFGKKSGHSTMKRKKPSTLQRAIDGVTEHLRHHPSDGVSQMRLANLNKRLAALG